MGSLCRCKEPIVHAEPGCCCRTLRFGVRPAVSYAVEGVHIVRPRMSPGEIELFLCAARGKHFAVEFGVGGSTFCLIDAGIDRVFSVESDITWIETIITHEHLRPHVASGRLTMHHGDIGPTRK